MRFRLNRKRSLEGFAPWICEVGAGWPGLQAGPQIGAVRLSFFSVATVLLYVARINNYSPQVVSGKRSSLLSAAKLAERVWKVYKENSGTDGTFPVTSLNRNPERSADLFFKQKTAYEI